MVKHSEYSNRPILKVTITLTLEVNTDVGTFTDDLLARCNTADSNATPTTGITTLSLEDLILIFTN